MLDRPRSRSWHRLAIAVAAVLIASLAGEGHGVAQRAAAAAGAGAPNRFDPHADATSGAQPSTAPRTGTQPEPARRPAPLTSKRGARLPMAPGSVALRAGAAARFTGSDGRLQVDVPAGAVTGGDLAQARGGSLSLRVSQVAPASGSSAGGSGHISFGTYRLQLVDGAGQPLSHGLRQPVKLTLHDDRASAAVDASGSVALVGGTEQPAATTAGPAGQTLSATASLSGGASTVGFNSGSPVASFGRPDPFNVDLSAGALGFELPIDLPDGPGGLRPPITLSYSSATVSESHNLQAAAPWVGEGWNLSLGGISWAERNVSAACGGCGPQWESTWQLTDPSGQGAELIPPSTSVATYYDDTGSVYYSSGSYPNEPLQWHTAPESHSRIYSYVGPDTLPGVPAHPSCFRVFEPNGLMEELGCTPDSVEYYYVPGSANGQYVAQWLPDLITDPQGNQVHVTYQSHAASAGGVSYTRDVVPATVEWDSPGCRSAQQACTGPAWAPLMRASFVAGSSIARSTSVNGSACNTGPQMRCDDPLDLSGSGGAAAPEVQSTFALNDLQVQVRSSGGAGWSTLRDYQFSYEVGGPGQMTDPVTGSPLSYAGVFDLTQVRVVGDDGSTALPVRTFGYTTATQHYVDGAFYAVPSGNCGYSYNIYCYLWSVSADGNSRYLATAANGLGLSQTFTWSEAQNNDYGVNSGDVHDPLSCTVSGSFNYPCDGANDQEWSHVVLTGQSDSVVRPSSAGSVTVTGSTSYVYRLADLAAPPCSSCTVGMYWGDVNDGDYLDFYNDHFVGFARATVTNPDGSAEVHGFDVGAGWGTYDPGQTGCSGCPAMPWWSPATALHGHEVELDSYDVDGSTLLEQVTTQYQLTCPPSGVSGTPPSSSGWGNWDGNLVSPLNPDNPVAVCDIHPGQEDTYTFDGASSGLAVPHETAAYVYDGFGNLTSITETTNDGGASGSPTTIVEHADYVSNDGVAAAWNGVTGTRIVDTPADLYVSDAGSTVHRDCSFAGYDGQPFATGQQPTLTLGEPTTHDRYTSCGTSANGFAASGLLRDTTTYDQYGNVVASADPDANAGSQAHLGCAAGGVTATLCTAYDGTFDALPVLGTNALNQSKQIGYGSGAGGGFGTWPASVTDENGQTATTAYDPLGRVTAATLPGETAGLTTTATSYAVWCPATGAQAPCAEIDTTRRLDSATTVTGRQFYDGWGHLVETRTPAPGGQDVVRYAFYDPMGREVFLSSPYFVATYTGAPGAAAFSTPDATQLGTTTTYVNLRQTNLADALSFTTTSTDSVACGDIAGDGACYERTAEVDPLGHQSATYDDALGREAYSRTYTGSNAATYAPYATTSTTYDLLDNVARVLHPDGVSATAYTYDDAGRVTGTTDPDRGTESFAYDQDGSLVQAVDARGAAGTAFAGYDGLDRPVWRNTTNSPTGAYVTFSYDSTAGGSQGVGRLTGETFSGGPGRALSGSYAYRYDARGQAVQATLTVGAASYPAGTAYNDAGQVLSETYPTGEVVTNAYTAQGWLQGVSRQQGSTTTQLIGGITYAGAGGAMGAPTGASLGGGTYGYSAAYDPLGHLTDTRLTRSAGGATLFEQARTFDGAGNVTGATTTLPQGTDVQRFCYDEQDRLTWAGSAGTPPCTGTAITPGTLTAAQYGQTFGYDAMDRLTSGPLGAYTYGDPAHLHAATGIGSTYSASYDAAGNMTCRAVTAGTSCAAGSQTGARPSYDNEGQLIAWQSPAGSPASSTADLYDGAGQRVEQQVTAGGTTATTVYVGDLEEVATSGSTTTTTTYYYAGGQRIALAVNGQLSYLASDGLGSADVALDGGGSVQASVLYAPYGTVRWSSGTMPTDYGFTGQHADAATGLDYYGARYYDPLAGQFTSADTVASGLNRYAYVDGNPVALTDPSGQSTKKKSSSHAKSSKSGHRSKSVKAGHSKTRATAAKKAHTSLPGCAYHLSCSLSDFEHMTVQQRLQWLKWFDATYGPSHHFQGWFEAIRAVLDIAAERHLIQPAKGHFAGSWFSKVDAAILQGIQDGFASHLGRTTETKNPGVKAWKAFFDAADRNFPAGRSGTIQRVNTLKQLWGTAEAATTKWGAQIADDAVNGHQIASPPGWVRGAFIGWGDVFRFAVTIGVFDPRSYPLTQFAVNLALFANGAPPVSPPNPLCGGHLCR
jgi:RHS repeat-associated protein